MQMFQTDTQQSTDLFLDETYRSFCMFVAGLLWVRLGYYLKEGTRGH